jgi:hypothetical protein
MLHRLHLNNDLPTNFEPWKLQYAAINRNKLIAKKMGKTVRLDTNQVITAFAEMDSATLCSLHPFFGQLGVGY